MKTKGQNMKSLRVALATLSMVAATSSAAPPDEGVLAYGIGGKGCGNYIENRRKPNQNFDNEMVEWTFGFISAYNLYLLKPQVKQTLPGSTILAYLDKYCRETPLATTGLGVAELIQIYTKP
jgi:hypothetical protein